MCRNSKQGQRRTRGRAAWLGGIAALTLAGAAVTGGVLATRGAKPIGVYHGPSVAVAYFRSPHHLDWVADARRRHAEALEAGDQAKADAIEREVVELQALAHQALAGSRDPVEAMAWLEPRLGRLRTKAGVSSFDRRSAHADDSPTRDVTWLLVAQFEPDRESMEVIWEVQSKQGVLDRKGDRR